MNRLRTVAIAVGFLVGIAASRLAPVDAWADRNSGGTYTLPSGNPVVSGTTITSTWANNTLNDIATNLTSSLDRAGRGAMSAPLQLASGTSSAPGLTFSAETTSGVYRFGSNDVRMQVASTSRQKWTSTGSDFVTETVTMSGASDGGVALTVTGGANGGSGNQGAAIVATGGASYGPALVATGTGTASGIVASYSGASGIGYESAAAIRVNATVDGGYGINVDGHTSLQGVGVAAYHNNVAIYGASAGTGGSPYGVVGFINGGSGGQAVAGAAVAGVGAFGGHFSAGNPTIGVPLKAAYTNSPASSAGARYDVFQVSGGDIHFSADVVAPWPDAGSSNTLTASNIVKAWGQINLAGPPALLSGFNVASVSCASNVITVTWQNAFTGATAYVVQPTISANDVRASVIHDYSGGSSASNAKFAAFDNAGTIINLCAAVTGYNGFTVAHIDFTAIGHQ